MKKTKISRTCFSLPEISLWASSTLLIVLSFCIFDRNNYITLAASLIGTTSILLNAKGNPLGQVLMVLFSLIYGYISYAVAYYGEMITYLGMTMPMAVLSLVSWIKHPYKGKRSTVAVNRLPKWELVVILPISGVVTAIFHFVLRAFHTANILPSTLSVTTSFLAVYLTFRRSPYFSVAYALNDIVLLILWSLASIKSTEYVSVTVCFFTFLINDIYAFISWKKMEKQQKESSQSIPKFDP